MADLLQRVGLFQVNYFPAFTSICRLTKIERVLETAAWLLFLQPRRLPLMQPMRPACRPAAQMMARPVLVIAMAMDITVHIFAIRMVTRFTLHAAATCCQSLTQMEQLDDRYNYPPREGRR
jgi:hypothetical protein